MVSVRKQPHQHPVPRLCRVNCDKAKRTTLRLLLSRQLQAAAHILLSLLLALLPRWNPTNDTCTSPQQPAPALQ